MEQILSTVNWRNLFEGIQFVLDSYNSQRRVFLQLTLAFFVILNFFGLWSKKWSYDQRKWLFDDLREIIISYKCA